LSVKKATLLRYITAVVMLICLINVFENTTLYEKYHAMRMRRYWREISQQVSEASANPAWPSAIANTEWVSAGATMPATSAPISVVTKDWQDATVPRMCGNRSSASRVALGLMIELPKL